MSALPATLFGLHTFLQAEFDQVKNLHLEE